MLGEAQTDQAIQPSEQIGTLLVNEGLVREVDVADAVAIQKEETAQPAVPLGTLLVKKKILSPLELRSLLESGELRDTVGTFAVATGRLDAQQLTELKKRCPPDQSLAENLMAEGLFTDADMKAFLAHLLDSPALGELAVNQGMLSEEALSEVLRSRHRHRTIGEILCDLNLITPLDLNAVLSKHSKRLRLGEMLVRQGLIDRPTLEQVLEDPQRDGSPLGDLLVRRGLLTEDQLYGVLSSQYNLPYLRSGAVSYDDGQRDILPRIIGKTFSRQYAVVPLRLANNTLTVMIHSPEALSVVQSLRSKRTDLRMTCVLVKPSTLTQAAAELYGDPPGASKNAPDPVTAAKSTPAAKAPAATGAPAAPRHSTPSPHPPELSPQQLLGAILDQALHAGAQAIHIDQGGRRAALWFRIGDFLEKPALSWMEEALDALVTPVMDAVKTMAGLDTSSRLPQEGVFQAARPTDSGGRLNPIEFYVTACPTLSGESLVIRRIPTLTPARRPLLNARAMAAVHPHLQDAAGMILIATSPGVGRIETLYNLLGQMDQTDRKVITVEDPILLRLPGTAQTQANPAAGLGFAALLRAALRLDPDVLLATDLPDKESAAIAFEAARRGVLVLTAVTAADAAGAVSVLRELNMPPKNVPLGLKAIVAQRHVRAVCTRCRQPYQPPRHEWRPLFDRFPGHLTFYKGTGCPDCGFSGYRGRVLLSEVLPVNQTVMDAIRATDAEHLIRQIAVRTGAVTMVEDGLSKLNQTTLAEISRVVPPEACDAFRCTRADSREADVPAGPAVFQVVLQDPDHQQKELRALHAAYELLIAQKARRQHRSAFALFAAYIKSQHADICRRHHVERVRFRVAPTGPGVSLTAAPD